MKIYKNKLTIHPRGNISKKKKRGIIIGATGATGSKSNRWNKKRL